MDNQKQRSNPYNTLVFYNYFLYEWDTSKSYGILFVGSQCVRSYPTDRASFYMIGICF